MAERARAVVIGGGVGGCSIAYWLTRLGWGDVVLLERAQLTSGSTFHSAGLVGQLRSSQPLTQMMMNSVELYRELADEVELETGWHEVGSLRLASSPERMEELRRQAAWAETFGLPLELISPAAAAERFPPLDPTGVIGAALLPTDGYLDPSQLTLALAKGARLRGADIRTETRVVGIDVSGGHVTGVEVEHDGERSTILADVVVNAGGIYAHEIGAMAGIHVPLVAMAHQYAITRPSGLATDMPTLRDPSLLVYFRGESGGLVAGGYERNPAPWGLGGIPANFNNKLLEEDWERFAPLFENATRRVPLLAEAEIVKLVNGPEAFTPDGEFILGESAVAGLWVAAGFCAHGIAGAGGMGRLVAEWIVGGQPGLDAWHMDSRRFGDQYRNRSYTLERTTEVYATYYDVKYPGQERLAGRPLRRSPMYERLAALQAVFGEKSGWERANWLACNESAGDESLRPRGWAGKEWSAAIGAEHEACRQRAALFDQTSFAKLEVSGPGALAALEFICANRLDRPPGRVVYTQLLNERGGIESDLTVTRLSEDRFRIITGTASGRHDRAWIEGHLPADGSVRVEDVTSRYACLCLWGPRARDILAPLTEADVSAAAFPYMTAAELNVGPVPCLAARVTFVGELGWELYCPMEYGARLWDDLWQAGQPHGLVTAGYRTIESLRLEKGYRVWGSDITSTDTPFEAGLGFAVAMSKGEFIGREALEKAESPERILSCLVLDDPLSLVLGEEPVRVDGYLAGRVTSGGYGYSVGRSIAYAYLPSTHATSGQRLEVNLFGQWVGGEVAPEPLYDPTNARVRA
ncbi:MAG TPA: FAD-dependent oxidoreductase [Acidimicrobiales bacterium]|nr:FAD-dependent oxidoreductase [Acidimicrobiales bacterium]